MDGLDTGGRLGSALLWVPFLILLVRWFCVVPDDAFITLRYAANVLDGHGPVFNPGERVEGFTSPLHLLVSVLVVALPGGSTLLKAKLVSVLFAGLALHSGRLLVATARWPRWATRLGLLSCGASWLLAHNAATAMDTALAAWAVTTLVLFLAAGALNDRPVLVGVFAAVSVLARPEMLAVVAALGCVTLLRERDLGPVRRVWWCGGAVLALAVTTVARTLYYGAVTPNTFDAKRAPLGAALHTGWDYLLTALQPAIFNPEGVHRVRAVGAALVLAGLFAAGAVAWAVTRSAMVHAAVAAGVIMTTSVLVGGDWMRGGRLVAPVALLLALTQVEGVVALGRLASRWRATASTAAHAVLAAALVAAGAYAAWTAAAVPAWDSRWMLDDRSLAGAGGYGTDWVRLATAFDCVAPGGLVAYSEMGFAPWQRRDLDFIDLRGLTNRRIARGSPRSARNNWGVADPDWTDERSVTVREVLERRPLLVVAWAVDPPRRFGDGAYAIVDGGTDVPGYAVYRRADFACPPGD